MPIKRAACLAYAMAAALTCYVAPAASELQTRAIDPAHSRATFSVTHLYVSKVTGSVPIVNGTVVTDPGSRVPRSVTATLDARKLDTHDDDRNDSLQGPDWFDTKRFPDWTFVSTAVEPLTANAFSLSGVLTIHGVARAVTLAATASSGTAAQYHAIAHLDRHAFGMRVTPLDGTIGDDLNIEIDVALK